MKAQRVNIFSSVGHIFSVVTTQLCCCSAKAAKQYLNRWVWLCSDKNLFTKKGEGGAIVQVWPILCCSLTKTLLDRLGPEMSISHKKNLKKKKKKVYWSLFSVIASTIRILFLSDDSFELKLPVRSMASLMNMSQNKAVILTEWLYLFKNIFNIRFSIVHNSFSEEQFLNKKMML